MSIFIWVVIDRRCSITKNNCTILFIQLLSCVFIVLYTELLRSVTLPRIMKLLSSIIDPEEIIKSMCSEDRNISQ
jgi:hypothetical protein